MCRHPNRSNSIEAFACSGVSKTLTDSMRRTAMDLGLTYRALADGGCTRQSCNEDIPRRWISTA